MTVVMQKKFRLDSQHCQGVSRAQIVEANSLPHCFRMNFVIQNEFIMMLVVYIVGKLPNIFYCDRYFLVVEFAKSDRTDMFRKLQIVGNDCWIVEIGLRKA
ncbi:hypothetical protein CsSME_00019701 [Camellia sinensis var. sinensis]